MAELDPSVAPPDPARPASESTLPGVAASPPPYAGGAFQMTDSLARAGVNPMGQQDPNDYSLMNPTDAVYSPAFLADVKADIERRQGIAPDDPDELRRLYFADLTFKNTNSLGIGTDIYDSNTMSAEDAARRGRLQSLYEKYPSFWERGGRGGEGLVQNLVDMALDPINLLPFGKAVEAVGVGAAGVKAALAGGSVVRGAVSQAVKTAAVEGTIMGGIGAAYDVGSQARDESLGLQDRIDWGQVGQTALTQGGLGAGFGALAGALGGAVGAGTTRALLDRFQVKTIADWPNARQAFADEAQRLTIQGQAAADPVTKARLLSRATGAQDAIGKVDSLFLEHGGTEEALGTARAAADTTEAADPAAAAAAAEQTPEERTRASLDTLGKQIAANLSDVTKPPLDGEREGLINLGNNVNWLKNADRNLEILNNNRAKADKAGNIDAVQQIDREIAVRSAMRDKIFNGDGKTAAQIQEVVDEYLAAQPATAAPAAAAAPPPPPTAATAPGAPPPAATPGAPTAAPTAPGPAPASAAGGGGAGPTAVAPGAPVPEVIHAGPPAEPGAAPAAAPAAPAPKAKATAGETAPIFTPTTEWQEVPEGAVLPPTGVDRAPDPKTGKEMVRLTPPPHPILTAPIEVASAEVNRTDETLTQAYRKVEGTRKYSYKSKPAEGWHSIPDTLEGVGYTASEAQDLTAQIQAQANKEPKEQRLEVVNLLTRDAIAKRMVEQVREKMGGLSDPPAKIANSALLAQVAKDYGEDASLSISVKRVLATGKKAQKTPLVFPGEEPPTSLGPMTVQDVANAKLTELLGQSSEKKVSKMARPGGMTPERKKTFTTIAKKEVEFAMVQRNYPRATRGRVAAEMDKFTRTFLQHDNLPEAHEKQLEVYRAVLQSVLERTDKEEAGRTTPASGFQATGERGAAPKGEARLPNPDTAYVGKGIPGMIKGANQQGFHGRPIWESDLHDVAQALNRAELEKRQDVFAITVKRDTQVEGGGTVKAGGQVFIDPIRKKAYDSGAAAARRPKGTEQPLATGGETFMKSVASPREEEIARANDIDPTEFATRISTLDPKIRQSPRAGEPLIAASDGKDITPDAPFVKTRDGQAFHDMEDFHNFIAKAMKGEEPAATPTPAPAAVAAPAQAHPKAVALAASIGVTEPEKIAIIEKALRADGTIPPDLPPAPTPEPGAPAEPAATETVAGLAGVPAGWTPPPGRKLALIGKDPDTMAFRTLSPNQTTLGEMLGKTADDEWIIGSVRSDISSMQKAKGLEDFVPAGKEPPEMLGKVEAPAAEVTRLPEFTPDNHGAYEEYLDEKLPHSIEVETEAGVPAQLTTRREIFARLRSHWVTDLKGLTTRKALDDVIAETERLGAALGDDFKLPSVDRAEGLKRVTALFNMMAPDQTPLAVDLVRRLGGDRAPMITEFDNSTAPGIAGFFTSTSHFKGEKPGTVAVGIQAHPDMEPSISVFHHEVAHWAFEYLFNDADRSSLMKWFGDTFYKKDGTLDLKKLDVLDGLGGQATEDFHEMWASLVQRRLATDKSMMPMPEGLFTKFAQQVKYFVKRWMGWDSKIDAALEPLYQKMLPDPIGDAWLDTVGSNPKTAAGELLVDGMRKVDGARRAIEVGLKGGTYDQIEGGMRTALTAIHGSGLPEAEVTRLSNKLTGLVRQASEARTEYDAGARPYLDELSSLGMSAREIWDTLSADEQERITHHYNMGTLVGKGSVINVDGVEYKLSPMASQEGMTYPGGLDEAALLHQGMDDNGTLMGEGFSDADALVGGKLPDKVPNMVPVKGQWEAEIVNPEGALKHEIFSDDELKADTYLPVSDFAVLSAANVHLGGIGENLDPLLKATEVANEAHKTVRDAFTALRDHFPTVEATDEAPHATAPRRPIDVAILQHDPDGPLAVGATKQSTVLNGVETMLTTLRTSEDASAVDSFIDAMDQLASITGRTGIGRKSGTVYDRAGGVHKLVWRELSDKVKAQGRSIVDRAYELLTDFDMRAEADAMRAEGKALAAGEVEATPSKNTIATFHSMSPAQMEGYKGLIDEALALAPNISEELWRIRRYGDTLTERSRAKGTWTKVAPREKQALAKAQAASAARAAEVETENGSGLASPKTLSDHDLIEAVLKEKPKSDRGIQLSRELVDRNNTKPIMPKVAVKDIPNELIRASLDDLQAAYDTASTAGNKRDTDIIRREVIRRSNLRMGNAKLRYIGDRVPMRAIDREARATIGTPSLPGVPENAPAMARGILEKMTHRNGRVESPMRTAMYRLLNIGGLTDEAVHDGITVGRLHDLVGKTVPEGLDGAATMFSLDGDIFNELRAKLRLMVGGLVEGKGAPREHIENIGRMAAHSGLLDSGERSAIDRGYAYADDPIKTRVAADQTLSEEAKPAAWYAGHLADHLAGETSDAERFGQVARSGEDSAKETASRLDAVMPRLRDAVAYVTNGLAHEQMREAFPVLADYGDVFDGAPMQVRPPAAPELGEAGLRNSNAISPDAIRVNAVLAHAADEGGEGVSFRRLEKTEAAVMDMVEKAGMGPRAESAVRAGVRGFTDPVGTLKAIRDTTALSAGHIYKEQGDLMNTYGLRRFSRQIAPTKGVGFNARVQERMTSALQPLLDTADKMSDVHGPAGQWLRRNKFWGDAAQPESWMQTVRTLRGMADETRQSGEVRALVDKTRAQLEKTHQELVDAEIPVGHIKENFFPQAWDEEKIRREIGTDRETTGFSAGLGLLLKTEAVSDGSPGGGVRMTNDEAAAKALEMTERMTDEGGVFLPPKAERRAARADSIDYQRVLRLHEVETDAHGNPVIGPDGRPVMKFAEAYKLLEPYMINHYGANMAKYFAAVSRRIEGTKDFGVNSHGHHDYMHVVTARNLEEAKHNATHLVSTKQIVRNNYMGRADDGGFEEIHRQIENYTPVSEAEAEPLIDRALSVIGDGSDPANTHTAYEILLDGMSNEGISRDGRSSGAEHRAMAIAEGLADRAAMTQRLTRDQVARADDSFRLLMAKSIGSNVGRKAVRTLSNINAVTMLSFTTLTATTDPFLALINSGNLRATVKAWGKYASDPSYRAAMRRVGASMEQTLHDRVAIMHGGMGSRFTRSFLNFTGLGNWDNFVRELGSAVGLEAFAAEQERALRAPGSRVAMQARARLARYGLEMYAEPGSPDLKQIHSMAVDSGVHGQRLRQGAIKFVNECVFSHTPDQIPLWAQTPLGRLAFQLKSFQVQMSRMALNKERGAIPQFYRWAEGTLKGGSETADSPWPLIYLMTLGAGAGMGANALKDYVQGRGGVDDKSHDLRDRRVSKLAEKFGWKANIHGPADQFLGSYVEGLMMVGGFGLLTDLLYQATQQADNGAWGYQRMLGSVLGPTLGEAPNLGWNVWGGAKAALTGTKSDKQTRNEERTAVDSLSRRIPFVGQMPGVRQALVDEVAGQSLSHPKAKPPAVPPDLGGWGGWAESQ